MNNTIGQGSSVIAPLYYDIMYTHLYREFLERPAILFSGIVNSTINRHQYSGDPIDVYSYFLYRYNSLGTYLKNIEYTHSRVCGIKICSVIVTVLIARQADFCMSINVISIVGEEVNIILFCTNTRFRNIMCVARTLLYIYISSQASHTWFTPNTYIYLMRKYISIDTSHVLQYSVHSTYYACCIAQYMRWLNVNHSLSQLMWLCYQIVSIGSQIISL